MPLLPTRLRTPALMLAIIVSVAASRAARAEDIHAVEARLGESARFLSSDELEGRGVGTKGLDKAADFLAEQFRKAGLKTDIIDGGPFQKFRMTTGSTLGDKNRLAFVSPGTNGEAEAIELKLNEQYNPLALGGSAEFNLPLVFAGYGITAKDKNYDDYAGIDVKGKAVIVMRHEPQQDNPHSAFDGTAVSQYAPYKRKISNAYEHEAALIIFCTDDVEIQKNVTNARTRWQTALDRLAEKNQQFKSKPKPTEEEWREQQTEIAKLLEDVERAAERVERAKDPLVAFDAAGPEEDGRNFPVLFCQRVVLNKIVQSALGTSLAKLEAEIDRGPTPQSRELPGWRVKGQTDVQRENFEVKNVIGVLDGAGPHANETIVIGAHYDHLGYGGSGSMAPMGTKEIHNGADDNGSGTTVLVELARQLASRGKPPARRIVFIAFTGEERGLIGSARYIRNPVFPLASTVAMLNLDMVGRLTDEKLIVHGTGSAAEFDALVDRYGKSHGFKITKDPSGFGPSDHSSFYAANVPVLFFFTGDHKDYHRPSDDFEKLNLPGMRRIGEMVKEIALELAASESRPQYVAAAPKAPAGGGGDRPYFGSIPDFSQEGPGFALSGVTKDGPADKGGIKAGDIIVQLGDSKIGNLEDFDSALRKFKAGDRVPVVVMRAGQTIKLEVTLDDPR